LAVAVVLGGAAFAWLWPVAERVPFPDGYLERERPSLFFAGHRGPLTDGILYDLVIEDVVASVVVRNWSRIDIPETQADGPHYDRLTRGASRADCLAAERVQQQRVLASHWRSAVWRAHFDDLRGHCLIVRRAESSDADLELLEHDDHWSIELRSSGALLARAPKAEHGTELRALFGARAGLSLLPGSPVYADDFTDATLLRALADGGSAARAVFKVIQDRVRLDDSGLVPRIEVSRSVSPEVVEAMLERDGALPFHSLIAGAAPETAELIYAGLVEALYAPLQTSKPFGPGHYGDRWKLQVRDRRPQLEAAYTRDEAVPRFAVEVVFRAASALVVQLGQPNVERFHEEFRTEIVNRVLANSGPGFDTAILARAEADIAGVVAQLRGLESSPNRRATLWAVVEQSPGLPQNLIEELRGGCAGDPQFLNDPVASAKWLQGETFCSRYLRTTGHAAE
jgi:hypothetical protein